MGTFLNADTIRIAVRRLGDSLAQTGMHDFLVLKRASVLSKSPKVVLSERNQPFMQAIEELTSCNEPLGAALDASWNLPPFINVFGTAKHSKGPFRSAKFTSNGPADTVSKSRPWQALVEVHDERPRSVTFRRDYLQHAKSVLLKAQSPSDELPRLSDAAIWFFRASDISALAASKDRKSILGGMVRTFVDALHLTKEEVALLFVDANALDESVYPEVLTSDSVASPISYLTLGSVEATPVTETAGKVSWDLAVSLAAKEFIILTGLSGTGKTRGAIRLSAAVTAGAAQPVELIPVAADWNDSRPLLGYRHPFGRTTNEAGQSALADTYEITPALRLVLRASHPDSERIPHFLILDEMNLSHVERYFSPVLSLLEAARSTSRASTIPLIPAADTQLIASVLQRENPNSLEAKAASIQAAQGAGIGIPGNLFIVGTVNVDETTYMFSPKVLDRAHVIEVASISPLEFVTGTGSAEELVSASAALELLQWSIERRDESERTDGAVDLLESVHTDSGLDPAVLDAIKNALKCALEGSHVLLGPIGFGLGYRVVRECFDYVATCLRLAVIAEWTPEQIQAAWHHWIDRAILQKVLPKLHGNRLQLTGPLTATIAFFSGGTAITEPRAAYQMAGGNEVGVDESLKLTFGSPTALPLCIKKLSRMLWRVETTGYAGFIE